MEVTNILEVRTDDDRGQATGHMHAALCRLDDETPMWGSRLPFSNLAVTPQVEESLLELLFVD